MDTIKTYYFLNLNVVISSLLLLLAACSHSPKDLATVEKGMSKEEVISIVGNPENKNVVNSTEIWDYPDSNRTIVFRKDTVYTILTSPEARADSVGRWLDKTNEKVKDGLGDLAEKAENAGERIKDGLKKDSAR